MNLYSKSTNETISNILDHYYLKFKEKYIVGILNEGKISNEEELYIKLVLVPQNTDIGRTWLKENLTCNVENNIHNVITRYNYNYKFIYGLSPILIGNHNIVLTDQDNNNTISAIYNESKKINKPRAVYFEDSNIYVYHKLIREYIPVDGFTNEFDLYIEVDYKKTIDLDENLHTINCEEKIDNGFVNYYYCKSMIESNKTLFRLLFTHKFDYSKLPILQEAKIDNDIKVVSLENNVIRPLDKTNYNDDINAGFVVFSKECINILHKHFYFYDLKLIPKNNSVEGILYDYLDDCIVFWEGEFNKLPEEIIEQIKKYNLSNKTEGIISPAMFKWQLQASWNYFEELLPNMQLANIISENDLDLAIDMNLDFLPPNTEKEYSEFIIKVLKITNKSIKDLRLIENKEILLNNIINLNYRFSSKKELFNNYQGFCNLLVRVLKYE